MGPGPDSLPRRPAKDVRGRPQRRGFVADLITTAVLEQRVWSKSIFKKSQTDRSNICLLVEAGHTHIIGWLGGFPLYVLLNLCSFPLQMAFLRASVLLGLLAATSAFAPSAHVGLRSGLRVTSARRVAKVAEYRLGTKQSACFFVCKLTSVAAGWPVDDGRRC